jgi:F1F0 ATPase subunit 2
VSASALPVVLGLGLGAGAGFGVGLLYFGGLWLTLTRMRRSSRPRLLLGASIVLRLAAVMAAFYGLLRVGWPVLAGGMFGFLAARTGWLLAKGGAGEARRPLRAPEKRRRS